MSTFPGNALRADLNGFRTIQDLPKDGSCARAHGVPDKQPMLVIRGWKEEIMTCSPISQQVAIPVIGFTAFNPGSGSGAASRRGDRQSDLLDSFAAVFVLMAVAFGPALTWLLVG